MQPKEINSFRCRAKNMGYTSITVKRLQRDSFGNDLYLVSAVEPISRAEVRAVYKRFEFRHLCRYGKSSQK